MTPWILRIGDKMATTDDHMSSLYCIQNYFTEALKMIYAHLIEYCKSGGAIGFENMILKIG
jgi:hypothetical protein